MTVSYTHLACFSCSLTRCGIPCLHIYRHTAPRYCFDPSSFSHLYKQYSPTGPKVASLSLFVYAGLRALRLPARIFPNHARAVYNKAAVISTAALFFLCSYFLKLTFVPSISTLNIPSFRSKLSASPSIVMLTLSPDTV